MRASDRDRDKVAAELRQHWVDGRIDVEELDRRLASVFAAQTIRELAELTYDLPSIPAAPPSKTDKPPRVRVGPPGVLAFTQRIVVPASATETHASAVEEIAPALNSYGYELVAQTAKGLRFERVSRPGWTLLVAVLVFPVGLLALLVRQTDRIQIAFEPLDARRTVMVMHGSAPRGLRKEFAQLRFP